MAERGFGYVPMPNASGIAAVVVDENCARPLLPIDRDALDPSAHSTSKIS